MYSASGSNERPASNYNPHGSGLHRVRGAVAFRIVVVLAPVVADDAGRNSQQVPGHVLQFSSDSVSSCDLGILKFCHSNMHGLRELQRNLDNHRNRLCNGTWINHRVLLRKIPNKPLSLPPR